MFVIYKKDLSCFVIAALLNASQKQKQIPQMSLNGTHNCHGDLLEATKPRKRTSNVTQFFMHALDFFLDRSTNRLGRRQNYNYLI